MLFERKNPDAEMELEFSCFPLLPTAFPPPGFAALAQRGSKKLSDVLRSPMNKRSE
jgi:hypothetical protein